MRTSRTAAPMTASARRIALLLDQSPQHELHDSAIAVVVGLAWSVDAHHRVKADITSRDLHRLRRAAFVQLGDPDNVEGLLTGKPERVALSPSGNCSGSTPIPIRLDR